MTVPASEVQRLTQASSCSESRSVEKLPVGRVSPRQFPDTPDEDELPGRVSPLLDCGPTGVHVSVGVDVAMEGVTLTVGESERVTVGDMPGVAVSVGVKEGVGIVDGVIPGVTVSVGVMPGVAVSVGVITGVTVMVGDGDGISVGVGTSVGVMTGVSVGNGVDTTVGVGVGGGWRVGVGVTPGVGVCRGRGCVGVGVARGLPPPGCTPRVALTFGVGPPIVVVTKQGLVTTTWTLVAVAVNCELVGVEIPVNIAVAPV
jgi:hypothetical protein